jgi:hypothetical protein
MDGWNERGQSPFPGKSYLEEQAYYSLCLSAQLQKKLPRSRERSEYLLGRVHNPVKSGQKDRVQYSRHGGLARPCIVHRGDGGSDGFL